MPTPEELAIAQQYYAGATPQPPDTLGNRLMASGRRVAQTPLGAAALNMAAMRMAGPLGGVVPTNVGQAALNSMTNGVMGSPMTPRPQLSFERGNPMMEGAMLRPPAELQPIDSTPPAVAAVPALGTGGAAPPQPANTNGVPGPVGPGIGDYKRQVLDAEKGIVMSYGDEKGALTKRSQAEQEKNEVVSSENKGLGEVQAQDARVAETDNRIAAERFDRDAKAAEAERSAIAEMKVDPQRIFQNEGMAVMSIIGGALGGAFQGLTGGKSNQFIDTLNTIIDRDINEQQRQIDSKTKANDRKFSTLQQLRERWKDDQTAKMQLRNLGYEAIKTKIAADAQRSDNPIIQANAEKAIADVNKSQFETQKNMAAHHQQQLQAEAAAAASARAAAEKQRFDRYVKLRELGQKDDEIAGKAAEQGGKVTERFVATGQDAQGNPTGSVAPSKESAEELRKQLEQSAALESKLKNIIALRENEGKLGRLASGPNAKWKSEAKVLSTDAKVAWSKASGLGTWDNGSERLAESIFGDPTSLDLTSDATNDSLKKFLAMTQEARQRKVAQLAGQQVTKQVGPDGREMFAGSGRQSAPMPEMPGSVKVNR